MKAAVWGLGSGLLLASSMALPAIANDSPSSAASTRFNETTAAAVTVKGKAKSDSRLIAQMLPTPGFSDTSPTHWANDALVNLNENYGCIVGYPDGTFRGEQFLTRYEFAAAVDACLGALVEQIQQDQQAAVDVEAVLRDLVDLQEELESVSEAVAPTAP